jgi:hypothetical protein
MGTTTCLWARPETPIPVDAHAALLVPLQAVEGSPRGPPPDPKHAGSLSQRSRARSEFRTELVRCGNLLRSRWCQEITSLWPQDLWPLRFSCKSPTKPRVDERTRTAVLSSLHVIIHVLQGIARTCKAGIFRRFSFLRLALLCTVLRSRWCQSSVRGSYHLSDWWAGVG